MELISMTERRFIFSSKEIEALQPGDKILVEAEIQRVVPNQTKVVIVVDNNTGIGAELSFAYDEVKAIPPLPELPVTIGAAVSDRDAFTKYGRRALVGHVRGVTETWAFVEFATDNPVKILKKDLIVRIEK
jgi:hypothetical protein